MLQNSLRWLIPLALLNGLIFVVLVPPWQHYDEPTHFEYAALLARHGAVPTAQAVDVGIRREIAGSMYRHNFYPPGAVPDLFAEVPPLLGSSQIVHPPLYYALAALPIRIMHDLPIEWQLYAARLLSLAFYVAGIVVAWRVTTVVVPDEYLVHGALPLLLIATPAYADIMTAVNNDVLVNFAAIAALLAMAHLLRDGLHPWSAVLLILTLLVAVWAKRTGVVLVPLGLMALFWAWQRGAFGSRRLMLIGGAVVAVGVLALLVSLQIGTAADGSMTVSLREWVTALDNRYLRLNLSRWLSPDSPLLLVAPQFWRLLIIAFTSFWLRFGWGQLSLGAWADWLMIALMSASALGLLLRAYQNQRQLEVWAQRWIWLIWVGVCVGWLSLVVRFGVELQYENNTYVPRGRYIFTMMLPHLWLVSLGWQGLLRETWRSAGIWVLPILFVCATVATWIMLILRFWI